MQLFLTMFPLIALLSVPLLARLMLRASAREASARGIALPADHGKMRRVTTAAILVSCAFLAARVALPVSVVPPNVLALIVGLGGFHALWWGMAMPMVREQDAALQRVRSQAPSDGRRVASLQRRDARLYLPPGLLPLPLVIAAVGCGVLAWRLLAATTPPIGLAQAVLFASFGLGELFLYRWWLHAEVRAPQRLQGDSPEALEQEWNALRRFRVRAVFGMHCVVPAVFLMFAVLLVESSRGAIPGATVGIVGGVVGGLVGLAGAVLGIMADIRQRRFAVRRIVS